MKLLLHMNPERLKKRNNYNNYMDNEKTTISLKKGTKKRLLDLAGATPAETRDDLMNRILDEVEQSRGGEMLGN